MPTTPHPVNDHIFIRRDVTPDTTVAGIHIPNAAKAKTNTGTVEHGTVLCEQGPEEVLVKPGNRVLFPEYAGTDLKIDDTEYTILHKSDIVAVLSN